MYIPNSAYRIQLRNGTTFQEAANAVPYLKDLGVGAVSPRHSGPCRWVGVS